MDSDFFGERLANGRVSYVLIEKEERELRSAATQRLARVEIFVCPYLIWSATRTAVY